MKRIGFFLSSLLLIVFLTSCEDLIPDNGLTESEVIEGLKEALKIGTDTTVQQATKVNGYFGNEAIKILFPEEANTVKNVVSTLPGGSILIDELVLKLNRAAESAAQEAGPIFKDAIVGITIGDGFEILNGGDDAATVYLKNNTESDLYNAFKPDIQTALTSVGAQQVWGDVITLYNSVPFVTPVNTDLADYTTDKALNGLFLLVAQEEKKIREDPLHRVTELLQKVFGK